MTDAIRVEPKDRGTLPPLSDEEMAAVVHTAMLAPVESEGFENGEGWRVGYLLQSGRRIFFTPSLRRRQGKITARFMVDIDDPADLPEADRLHEQIVAAIAICAHQLARHRGLEA